MFSLERRQLYRKAKMGPSKKEKAARASYTIKDKIAWIEKASEPDNMLCGQKPTQCRTEKASLCQKQSFMFHKHVTNA